MSSLVEPGWDEQEAAEDGQPGAAGQKAGSSSKNQNEDAKVVEQDANAINNEGTPSLTDIQQVESERQGAIPDPVEPPMSSSNYQLGPQASSSILNLESPSIHAATPMTSKQLEPANITSPAVNTAAPLTSK